MKFVFSVVDDAAALMGGSSAVEQFATSIVQIFLASARSKPSASLVNLAISAMHSTQILMPQTGLVLPIINIQTIGVPDPQAMCLRSYLESEEEQMLCEIQFVKDVRLPMTVGIKAS